MKSSLVDFTRHQLVTSREGRQLVRHAFITGLPSKSPFCTLKKAEASSTRKKKTQNGPLRQFSTLLWS